MNIKQTYLILIFAAIGLCSSLSAQNLRGVFRQLAGSTISLRGFEGFETYRIDSTQVAPDGSFALRYEPSDYGMGVLEVRRQIFMVILSGEDILLQGEVLSPPEGVLILQGKQNQQWAQYASEQPRREQTLSAWSFLQQRYGTDSLFVQQQAARQTIEQELVRIRAEDRAFLTSLPAASYISWYLPVRKFMEAVQSLVQRPEEIPAAIERFRTLDYGDSRLWKSGMLREAVEAHFWLINQLGIPRSEIYTEMHRSIDLLLQGLQEDERRLNAITDHLFALLEQSSLFEASEYLALKVLNEASCTLDSDLSAQLESYRKMKVGNIAPDILWAAHRYLPTEVKAQKLSELKANYTLVVFAANWCPHCQKEIPRLAARYPDLKARGLEVVLVSLDETPEEFAAFAGSLPFISSCDLQKWNSPVVKAYHVFGTPTFLLLDSDRKILLRPRSTTELETWMKQGGTED